MKKILSSVIVIVLLLTVSITLVACDNQLICECPPCDCPEPTPPCNCPEPTPPCDCPDPPIIVMPNVEVSIINANFTSAAYETFYNYDRQYYSTRNINNLHGSWGMFYMEVVNSDDTAINVLDFVLTYDDRVAFSLPHVSFDSYLFVRGFPIIDSSNTNRFDRFLSDAEVIMPKSTKRIVVNFNLPKISETEFYAIDTTKYTVQALLRNPITNITTEIGSASIN